MQRIFSILWAFADSAWVGGSPYELIRGRSDTYCWFGMSTLAYHITQLFSQFLLVSRLWQPINPLPYHVHVITTRLTVHSPLSHLSLYAPMYWLIGDCTFQSVARLQLANKFPFLFPVMLTSPTRFLSPFMFIVSYLVCSPTELGLNISWASRPSTHSISILP